MDNSAYFIIQFSVELKIREILRKRKRNFLHIFTEILRNFEKTASKPRRKFKKTLESTFRENLKNFEEIRETLIRRRIGEYSASNFPSKFSTFSGESQMARDAKINLIFIESLNT